MKTVETYMHRLQGRATMLKEKQLGDDMFNQVMVKKEVNVLESVIDDLKELDIAKKNRCFSYWTC